MTSYEGEKLLPDDKQNTRLCRFCCTHSCQSPAVVVNANWLGFRQYIALGHEMNRARQLRLVRKASSHSISFGQLKDWKVIIRVSKILTVKILACPPYLASKRFPKIPNPPTLHPANDSSVSVDCSRHGVNNISS